MDRCELEGFGLGESDGHHDPTHGHRHGRSPSRTTVTQDVTRGGFESRARVKTPILLQSLLRPWLLLIALLVAAITPGAFAMRPARVAELRQETVDMFYHGYDHYMRIAFPEDEVSFAAPNPPVHIVQFCDIILTRWFD